MLVLNRVFAIKPPVSPAVTAPAPSNELCYSIDATNPLEKNHILIIPKRHVPDSFELYRPETNAALDLLDVIKRGIESLDRTVRGFNVGMEAGGNLDNKDCYTLPEMLNPAGFTARWYSWLPILASLQDTR